MLDVTKILQIHINVLYISEKMIRAQQITLLKDYSKKQTHQPLMQLNSCDVKVWVDVKINIVTQFSAPDLHLETH